MQIQPHRPTIGHPRPNQKPSDSSNLHNEPIDGWDPTNSPAMAKLAPYSMAVIGGAAGAFAGLADGVGGAVGGAIALGTAGATLVTVGSAFAEMGGSRPNYKRNALIGAGIGAALGVAAGLNSSSGWVGAGLAVAGAFGAGFGTHILQDS